MTSHPVVDRYITNLRAGLATMPVADQQEVERDIRSHIAEAMAAGTPIDQVLQALGPADALARAYALELLLDDSRSKAAGISGLQRFVSLAGLVALTSIPTIVIVSVLGAVGVSLSVSGLVVALAGIAVAAGLTTIFGQPLVLDIHPVWAVILGPVMSAAGVACLVGLYYYLRWLGRTVLQFSGVRK